MLPRVSLEPDFFLKPKPLDRSLGLRHLPCFIYIYGMNLKKSNLQIIINPFLFWGTLILCLHIYKAKICHDEEVG